MPIELITGPPNSGRAGAVRERLLSGLERDPVLVVPTGDDAARFERQLCGEGGAVLGVTIRTFASLFEDVAASTGVELAPLLSAPERLALVPAAIAATPLRVLRRSAARVGFAPALDRLIAELGAALLRPEDLEEAAADLGEDGAPERELAMLYRRYVELREDARQTDAGSRAEATLAGLAENPGAWGGRPVLIYGFDDLTAAQRELIATLATATEVVVAVPYEDREALAPLASLRAGLEHELGAEVVAELAGEAAHTERPSLRHLDRWLFEPGAPRIDPDDGLVLLESAGELGEAEAIGGEIASLLAAGTRPDEIAIVVRDPAGRGPALGRTLSRLAIPVAVEAAVPLERTAVGRSLVALCRAASPAGTPADLLAHLRSDPGMPAGPVDWLERGVRRERPGSVDEAISGWQHPPRHLATLRAAGEGGDRLRALAAIARELAEAPHRGLAPVSDPSAGPVPFEPVELRAAAVAAELLEQLAALDRLPGCEVPDLEGAAEALAGASVPLWRGPADGRVRIIDPARARATRVRHLFCASLQEGEFPRRGRGGMLLSDERRARLGLPELARREGHEWERYLFFACVTRPTERLYLSWQSCDDDGMPTPRSPFIDDVLDLFTTDPEAIERMTRRRGLDRVGFEAARAPTERELARAIALDGDDGALDRLDLPAETREAVAELLAAALAADRLPGPLRVPAVLAELGRRPAVSPSSLEGWIGCSYRWFIDHELRPQRLDPAPDPLRVGAIAHAALERLYADPPGDDAIPRPGDLGRWRRAAAELIDAAAIEAGMRPDRPADAVILARLRAQITRFLADEAASETELRPRPELLEARFGFEDGAPGIDLGDVEVRGSIDRIDVGPDGRRALVRDYKTGASVPGWGRWEDEGRLQLQLYILAARESLGLDPIGGVYQPLGARRDRRARGIVDGEAPEAERLDLVRTDRCDRDELEVELGRARELATSAAAAMRAGEIDRNPIGGRCPRYCAFQAICRIEREVGATDANGGA